MSYKLLPFRFVEIDEQVFLTNFVGDYLYLSKEDFSALISGRIEEKVELRDNLLANCFIARDSDIDFSLDLLATRYRTKKAYVGEGVCLHMVVTTLRCNQYCTYCQASAKMDSAVSYDMDIATAKKVAAHIYGSKSSCVKIEFQGGEPSLNFAAIKAVVLEFERLNFNHDKFVEYVVCTNLLNLKPEHLDFYKRFNFDISTSVDGPKSYHDTCRKDHGKIGTFDRVKYNIMRVRQSLGDKVDALLTITKYNLSHLREVVDTYVDLGFHGIVLRPLNPYGRYIENMKTLNYSVEEYIEAYKDVIRYIIDLNKKGIKIREGYTALLVSRMLTPFPTGFVDLQSPCGAALSGIIYNYDGKIYACDEGRMLSAMGDDRFEMETIDSPLSETYYGSLAHELVKESIVETIPVCADCPYRMWCGADPVRNYATEHYLQSNKASNEFCKRHKMLFQEILKLIHGNPSDKKVLYSWAWGSEVKND